MTATTQIPANRTITWNDGFIRFRAEVVDGAITEYCNDKEYGHWVIAREPKLDSDPGRESYDLYADGDVEYAAGPTVDGGYAAWIDGVGYRLTDPVTGESDAQGNPYTDDFDSDDEG